MNEGVITAERGEVGVAVADAGVVDAAGVVVVGEIEGGACFFVFLLLFVPAEDFLGVAGDEAADFLVFFGFVIVVVFVSVGVTTGGAGIMPLIVAAEGVGNMDDEVEAMAVAVTMVVVVVVEDLSPVYGGKSTWIGLLANFIRNLATRSSVARRSVSGVPKKGGKMGGVSSRIRFWVIIPIT